MDTTTAGVVSPVFEGERRTLHHPGRDDSRNIREIVIAAVGGEQFGRRIVVEHPVVLQQTGSLGERDRDVALPGLPPRTGFNSHL